MSEDWRRWHQAYDDPSSSLSARLRVVRRMVGAALDELGPRGRRILSLCAGDGRDVLPELAGRPTRRDVLLVELDQALAQGARDRASSLGLDDVRVTQADAGDPAAWRDAIPVDLLLLCGIFGNVVDEDIRRTLAAVPAMVAPGGFVIWTRGWFEQGDLRPEVRRWSEDVGLVEVAYEGEPATYGVGCYRIPDALSAPALPARLFAFVR